MIYRWKYGACLPQLKEHEAVVSDVIEISAATEVGGLTFNSEVKLVLSHSAADLEGYELVLIRLADSEKNEWEEIAGCIDIRHVADIDDYPCPNNVPYSFPVVLAGIIKCSTYAVVSRLKLSPTFTITVSGGTFVHPNYPEVTITVPQKAVTTETRLSLELGVQEVPQDEFQGHGLFCGPILRLPCSSRATFLKPVTIQLPVSLGNRLVNIPQPSECRVRIFFLSSERETKEWVEISDKLENPASYDGKLVKFKVQHFSRFAFVVGSAAVAVAVTYLLRKIWIQPQVADFVAYFDPKKRLGSLDILFLICCPAHQSKEEKHELEKAGLTPCVVTSKRDMIPGRDKAFVFVSGGINLKFARSEDMGDFFLRFHGNKAHRDQLQVRLISDKVYCNVQFRKTPDTTENNNLLSTLDLTFSSSIDRQTKGPKEDISEAMGLDESVSIKPGTVSAHDFFVIAHELGPLWKKFGLALKVPKAVIDHIEANKSEVSDKCYGILRRWQEMYPSDATYHRLARALQHPTVARVDVAFMYCGPQFGKDVEAAKDAGSSVPAEIRGRGPEAERAFQKAMKIGKVKVYRGRIMLLGQDRAGKTSLKKSLLGLPFYPKEESTVGVEVDRSKCELWVGEAQNWMPSKRKKGEISEFEEELARFIVRDLTESEADDNDSTATDPNVEEVKITDELEERKDYKKPKLLSDVDKPVTDTEEKSMIVEDGQKVFSEQKPVDKNDSNELQLNINSTTLPNDVTDLESINASDLVVRYLQSFQLEDDIKSKEIILTLWDFAGQHLYYASHSVFLSRRAVYILVYNLNKNLLATAEPCVRQGLHDIRLDNPNDETNLDNLLSWLVSVHNIRSAANENVAHQQTKLPYQRPAVIIVGTNLDQPFEEVATTEKRIKDSIIGKEYANHVITTFFAVDNSTENDEGVRNLRHKIMEVLEGEPYMPEEVPLRWFKFERAVDALVAKQTYFMDLDQLVSVIRQVCQIEDEEEVTAMLNFYHDLGVIVKHGQTVVLQAQWLIDLFKQLITVPPFNDAVSVVDYTLAFLFIALRVLLL
ncbi:PREDICTED: uncharacterized protein LOC107329441 [Acropora digitifera]|uniref:uncharacterized protein LOC107329441 n=1 Tax=Acropora digitifera TaxID=70779 RepID=UPI00077A689B|nr:PREDICTED: uncharacterized protein LOC107329441 [Acropora digitifera]